MKIMLTGDPVPINPDDFGGSDGQLDKYTNLDEAEKLISKLIPKPWTTLGETYLCELEYWNGVSFIKAGLLTWCRPVQGGVYQWSNKAVPFAGLD